MSNGYKILKVYEVYHFKKFAKYDQARQRKRMFESFVNLFLKGKQEASGWPKANMTEEEKIEYIDEYERVEGIRLDPNNIQYNSGKRATNKLFLKRFLGEIRRKQ